MACISTMHYIDLFFVNYQLCFKVVLLTVVSLKMKNQKHG